MTGRNVLFLLIDALRYETLADRRLRRLLAPNVDGLLGDGDPARIVAQAPNTQFALPALYSATYPLDYGGYTKGLHGRPRSFVECIRDAGYATGLFTSCILYNRDLALDRGFDKVVAPVNNRRALKQDIQYRLKRPVQRWRAGQSSDADIAATLDSDYAMILDNLVRVCTESARTPTRFSRLRAINDNLVAGARRELALLGDDPLPIAHKLATIPDHYYWSCLGKRGPGPRTALVRGINKMYRTGGRSFPEHTVRLGHYDEFDALAEEVVPDLAAFVKNSRRPWFALLHVMDLHSYPIRANQLLRRPGALARRMRRVHTIRSGHEAGWPNRSLLYDLAFAAVDTELGRLLTLLEDTGQLANTVILLTADHGRSLEGLDPRPSPDLTRRFYRECLEVPLVISDMAAPHNLVETKALLDSKDVGVTLLDLLGVTPDASFKGTSACDGQAGRWSVISEHAGRGDCDLANDDLYFVVTGDRYKAFTVLQGSELALTELYDLQADPHERNNLVGHPEHAAAPRPLLAALEHERSEVLGRRGYRPAAATLGGAAS